MDFQGALPQKELQDGSKLWKNNGADQKNGLTALRSLQRRVPKSRPTYFRWSTVQLLTAPCVNHSTCSKHQHRAQDRPGCWIQPHCNTRPGYSRCSGRCGPRYSSRILPDLSPSYCILCRHPSQVTTRQNNSNYIRDCGEIQHLILNVK
ncbi:uncharacterized protein LOC144488192 [Mustelus asterias]